MDVVMITEELSTEDLEAPLLEKKISEVPTAIPFESDNEDIMIDFKDDESGLAVGTKIRSNTRYFVVGSLLGIGLQVIVFIAGLRLASEGKTLLEPSDLSFLTLLAFLTSRFSIIGGILAPPILTILYSKLKGGSKKASFERSLQSIFDCLHFQFGLFFGCVTLRSVVSLCMISLTAPIGPFLAYYGACMLISFCAVLAIIKQFHCTRISSIELAITYDKDDDI